jgi:alpha-beta hydrolase superfamily lysophospholipase
MSIEDLIDSDYVPNYAEFSDYIEQNWLPLTGADGIPLFTYRIRTARPRALLFYFHGFLSYSLEFDQLGYEMAREGFECFALDHRGHGQSGGMVGYFESLDHLVDDATTYVNKVKEIYGDLPVFLAGTSMGGAITVNVSERVAATGMILLAPAFGLYAELNCCLSVLLCCFTCLCPSAFLPNVRERPVSSRNREGVEAYRSNKNVTFGNTRAITVSSLFKGMDRTLALAPSIRTPFVLVQGGSDFITSEAKAHRFYQSANVMDKDYWHYRELHHAIFLEPEFREILGRLKRWLMSRVN